MTPIAAAPTSRARWRSRAAAAAGVAALLAVAAWPGAAAGGFRQAPPGEPAPPAPPDDGLEPVLLRCAAPCDDAAERIAAAGGVVTRRYLHLDGLAARIPRSALAGIGAWAGPGAITKDHLVRLPDSMDDPPGRLPELPCTGDEDRITIASAAPVGGAAAIAALAGAHPDAYAVNAGVHGVASLHAAGITGEGVIVAVIDSGMRPGYPHLTSDGSVIGGLDFVGDGLPYSSFINNGHGTYVAGMISANANLVFPATSAFVRAVRTHLPDAVVGTSTVPMVGSAPLARIFVMRVFPPFGSAPNSVILAAIDRAIELRRMHDRGEPGGVDIQVANLSLSGPTLNPGRDLFDAAVDRMLAAGIVVVDSAANAGPSGLTIGSPGSSYGSLNVGAASLAGNERIRRELELGPGFAALFRPSAAPQAALFSSRGPVADGRADPDVVASGFACYGMGLGSTTTVNLASGTSFSAPTVAGIAALLRQAFPAATARQIRNAIVLSANPAAIPGAGANDQGAGMVDARAAHDLLAAGLAPDAPPAAPIAVKSVAANIRRIAGVAVEEGTVTRAVPALPPGGRHELVYAVAPNVTRIEITVADVNPSEPPSGQNGFFGDDLMLWVHSARTSRHAGAGGGSGDYLLATYTSGGSYPVEVADTGLVRITLLGSWTNAGTVAASLGVVPEGAPAPQITAQGTIAPYQAIVVPVEVVEGVARADFRLSWREDWGNYPVNDIDMIVFDPDGLPFHQGATLAAPESFSIFAPRPGRWQVRIDGFEIHTGDDRWKLRVALDGRVVR